MSAATGFITLRSIVRIGDAGFKGALHYGASVDKYPSTSTAGLVSLLPNPNSACKASETAGGERNDSTRTSAPVSS